MPMIMYTAQVHLYLSTYSLLTVTECSLRSYTDCCFMDKLKHLKTKGNNCLCL